MGIIRLLLALSVLAAHCGAIFGWHFVGGQIAVQSFFIMSGFYMSFILNEKYIGANKAYRLFITNRFLRLYPIYWTILLLTVLACALIMLVTKGQSAPKFGNYRLVHSNGLSLGYLILTNIVIFGQDLAMFTGIHPGNGSLFFTGHFMNSRPPVYLLLFVPQAWTLALEMMFYLIAPAIVKRMVVAVFLLTASFLLRFFMYNYWGFSNDPWTFRFFPTEIMFFLLGYLSYQLYQKLKGRKIPRQISLLILLFMIFFTAQYFYLPELKIKYLPFGIRECLYFLSVTLSIPFLFSFLKNNDIDNRIGELSYPVYISHFLVSMVCHSIPVVPITSGWGIALVTVVFSFFVNKLIAAPVEKFRQSRLHKSYESDKMPAAINANNNSSAAR